MTVPGQTPLCAPMMPLQNLDGQCCYTCLRILILDRHMSACLVLWQTAYETTIVQMMRHCRIPWASDPREESHFCQLGIHAVLWKWKKSVDKDEDCIENNCALSDTVVNFCEIFTHLTYKWFEKQYQLLLGVTDLHI